MELESYHLKTKGIDICSCYNIAGIDIGLPSIYVLYSYVLMPSIINNDNSDFGTPDRSTKSFNITTESEVNADLENSHRRRGPLNYDSVKAEDETKFSIFQRKFRRSKDNPESEIIDSNEFIEILHQPFMIPIDQFQLKLRASNVVKTSGHFHDPNTGHISPIPESKMENKTKNSLDTEPKVKNDTIDIDGSGHVVENSGDVDHSGEYFQEEVSGMKEQEIEGSGDFRKNSDDKEYSSDSSEISVNEASGIMPINIMGKLPTSNMSSTFKNNATKEQQLSSNGKNETTNLNSTSYISVIEVMEVKQGSNNSFLDHELHYDENDEIIPGSFEETKEMIPLSINTTSMEDILTIDELGEQNGAKNDSKFASEVIDSYIISPQYLIQNKPSQDSSEFISVDEEDDLIVNIVPLKLQTNNHLSEIEDNTPETSNSDKDQESENATTYRFVFPTHEHNNIEDQAINFASNYISNLINDEQILVDESGLPKNCAGYVEKVKIFSNIQYRINMKG